ncbi:MAG: hypothetical protein DRJ15_06040 [Bacteroidetes bacterium]|nr:MAG: hypothetical protein DRJ15_06040 [Bacteroidota bacterium]
MKTFIQKNYVWILFLLLVSAGSFSAELINSRMDMRDLEVYYRAADRLTEGGELYRAVEDNPWEHYVYKYAPPAAMLFIPFLPLGIPLSKIIYWILLSFILGTVLYNLKRLLSPKTASNRRVATSLLLGIIIVGTHFFRELHLGQVNLLLLGIYIFALCLLQKEKPMGFAALIAVSIFIKPFGLIFLPLLIIMGRFRELLYFTGFTILMILLPMLFYADSNTYFELYVSWYRELTTELGAKQDLFSAGNHTIFSILARYSPLGLLPIEGSGRHIFQLGVMLSLALLLLWFYFRRPVPERALRLYIVLIAIIPLLAFTSYNAFIFTLPLIIYLLFRFGELNILFKIILIISCVFIGGNIYDLAGKDLYNYLWSISIYSWGTIGLLLTLFAHWNKFASLK